MRINTKELLARKEFLEELIRQIESALACAPSGRLRISHKNERVQYYLKTSKADPNGKYVRKSDMPRAAAIAQRDYNAEALGAALRELEGIDRLLGALEQGVVEETYEGLILPRKKLVIPATVSDEEFARVWQDVKYTGKGFKAGDKEIYSLSGTRVRSKSEGDLDDMFADLGVPRRYEYPVILWDGRVIYPDFMLLNVKMRKEYLWEHLGSTDDPVYMRRNTDRINDLIMSGWIPGDNLIISMESDVTPLNINIAKEVARKVLL